MPSYQEQIDKMLTPGGFEGTAGFKFARDQGLEAAKRKMNSMGMGNSGNMLAELTRLGSGYAAQDYGSHLDRLSNMQGREQNFALGAYGAGNQFALGQQSNAMQGQRDWWGADQGYDANDIAVSKNYNDWNLAKGNQDLQRGNMLAQMYFRGR